LHSLLAQKVALRTFCSDVAVGDVIEEYAGLEIKEFSQEWDYIKDHTVSKYRAIEANAAGKVFRIVVLTRQIVPLPLLRDLFLPLPGFSYASTKSS
jgi:hypothetical protein